MSAKHVALSLLPPLPCSLVLPSFLSFPLPLLSVTRDESKIAITPRDPQEASGSKRRIRRLETHSRSRDKLQAPLDQKSQSQRTIRVNNCDLCVLRKTGTRGEWQKTKVNKQHFKPPRKARLPRAKEAVVRSNDPGKNLAGYYNNV